jgi:hypothetical protein
MRLLVLDTIHGGKELAGFLREQGHFVDSVDVYKGTSVVDTATALHREYDLVIAPVHLVPTHPLLRGLSVPVVSHHQAVRWVLGNHRPMPMVEITGSRGKTTTASAVAAIMEGPGILHTSTGTFRYPGRTVIGTGSITPAALVPAAREAARTGGWLVAEVSLGFIGSGDLGILTSPDDYLIAGGMRHALQEKVRSGQGMPLVLAAPGINAPGLLPCGDLVDIDGDCCSSRGPGEPRGFRNRLLTLEGYRTPLMLAAAAGRLLGQDISPLASFQAVPGRMSSSWEGDVFIVDNSNSGTTAEGACAAAAYARETCNDQPVTLVIGKEEGAVCEGFPAADVEAAVREIRPARVIVVGDSYDRLVAPAGTELHRCRTLAEGREQARSLVSQGCIVLAVKYWR